MGKKPKTVDQMCLSLWRPVCFYPLSPYETKEWLKAKVIQSYTSHDGSCDFSLVNFFDYKLSDLGSIHMRRQILRYLGQAASDFTKEAYVVKYLIRVGRSKIPKKEHLTSYVNAS